jgi:hypothetical protein
VNSREQGFYGWKGKDMRCTQILSGGWDEVVEERRGEAGRQIGSYKYMK